MRSFATFTKVITTFQDMFVLPDAKNTWFSSEIGQVNLITNIIAWNTFFNRSWTKIRCRTGVVTAMNGPRPKEWYDILKHIFILHTCVMARQLNTRDPEHSVRILKLLYLQQILYCLEKITWCHLLLLIPNKQLANICWVPEKGNWIQLKILKWIFHIEKREDNLPKLRLEQKNTHLTEYFYCWACK